MKLNAADELLTPREVAKLFRVHQQTVRKWALTGRLTTTYTLGGHRRFYRSEVMAMLGRPEDDS